MKKLSYLLILILGLFISGCDSDDDDELLPFSIRQSEVTFTAKGGEGTIEVEVPGAFQVAVTADWCSATATGNQVKVNVQANPEYLSRSALVNISYSGHTLSVPVTQEGSILILEDKSLTFKPAKGRYAYLIGNNVAQWNATTADGTDWCTPVISGDTLILQMAFNPKATERTTTVSITSGKVNKEILVIQEGINILPSQEEILFTAGGGTEKVIFTDLPEGWTAQTPDDWCSLNQSGDTLFATAPLYTETTDRNTTITIAIGEVSAHISVTQSGIKPLNEYFCTSKANWYFNPVETNGDYTLIFQMIDQQLAGINPPEILASAYLRQLSTNKGSHVLTLITNDGSALSESNFTYNFVPVDGTEDQIEITFTLGVSGDYAAWYYNNIQGIKYLASYLNATFTLTADDPIAPTKITFTDLEDTDLSFTLNLNQ